MINFFASIIPLTRLEDEDSKIPYKLSIRGVAVDTSVNKNNWRVSQQLMEKIAEDLRKRNLRVNHGGSVTDVIGRIKHAEVEAEKIIFEGEIIGSDPITTAVKEKLMNGLLDSVSIGMEGFKVVCSTCGANTRDGLKTLHKPEDHEPAGHEVILDGEVKELSIVLDPAYKDTKIRTADSFVAALESYLTVSPHEEGETNEVGDDQEGRPTEKEKETGIEGDRMSTIIPTAEPSDAKAPTFEDILRVLQDSFGRMDSKLAEIDARLKAIETAEEAKRTEKAKRHEPKEEAGKDEEDEEEDTKDTFESKLTKSTTTMAAASGRASWIAELEDEMRKAQRLG